MIIAMGILITFNMAALFNQCSIISLPDSDKKTEKTKESITTRTKSEESTSTSASAATATLPVTGSSTDLSEEIETMFAGLDKNVGNITNIFIFIDKNIKDASPAFASEMLYSVIKLCEEYKFDFTDKFSDPSIQEAIISALPSFENIDLDILADSSNEKVKELAREAIDKKYKLMAVEGFIMPLVDYKSYDKYRPYLTEEMSDYLDIKLDESEKPSVMDAAIVIPINDFVERIIKSMDYISKYPNSSREDEVEHFNKGRIYMYLNGIDNNPVFDLKNKILPGKLAEFQDVQSEYSDTAFGVILARYLDLLAQENYIRTQKVDDFLENI